MLSLHAGEDNEYVWEGPEPVGAEGVRLKRAAVGVLGEIGGDPTAAIMRIQSHPLGTELRRQTFAGWTVNGDAVTPDLLDRLELDPDRANESWAILLGAWALLGFLGPAVRRAFQREEARVAAGRSPPVAPG